MGGSSGGGTQTTQTVQKADPWSGQQPHLRRVMDEAERLYGDAPLSFFPGQTFAPFSPETELALMGQTSRAITGSPVTESAKRELQSTLGGEYLDAGNPHFDRMANRITAKVLPQIDARFAVGGGLGSGLHGRAVGEGLGDALGALAYQNYGDERQRMMQGMLFAPQMANQDYFDIAKLGEVGGALEDQAQRGINEAIARHEFGQQAPWQQLGLYNALVQGNYGGTTSATSTSQAPRGSIGQGMLGGGLAGAGLGYQIGGLPGAGIGGGLGLLAGLF